MPDTLCPSCGAPFGFPDLCGACRGGVRFLGRAFASVTTGLACESCEAPLHELRLGTVRVDVCLGCHGLWLDRGELHALVAQPPTKVRGDALPPADAATKGFRDCPRCRKRLERVMQGGATLLRCREHGVWLAASTLLSLLQAAKGGRLDALPAAVLALASSAGAATQPAPTSSVASDVGGAVLDGAELLNGVGVVVDIVGAILSAIDLPG